MEKEFDKDLQFYKFCAYGFLKNLRLFEPFLMVFLLQKLCDNYTQIGILYSLRFVIRVLLEIPSGIIADALGRKGSMVFAYICYILSFISYYFAGGFYTLLIPTIFFGIADAFRTGTHKAMIVDYLLTKGWGSYKTKYYGYTRSWSQFGSATSSLIVFMVYIIKPDYSLIFLITTIPYILGIINLVSYPSFLNASNKKDRDSAFTSIKSKLYESINVFKSRKKIKILAGTSTFFGYHHSLKDYLQPLVLQIGLSFPLYILGYKFLNAAFLLPLIYFFLYLITTIASRNAGKIKMLFKTDKRTIQILGTLGAISGISAAILSYFNYSLIALIPFLCIFIFINFQRPAVVSYVTSHFNRTILATSLSIESQLGSFIAAIFAFLIGYLTDIVNLPFAIAIASILLFLLTVIKWFPDNENN